MSKPVLLSIMGLYNYDDTIFENMQIPEGMDKELIVDSIISDCMELETVYPEPDAMKAMIAVWSKRELPVWNRIRNAELAEYNPIENYHRTEHSTETLANYDQHTGTDSNQASGTDSINGGSTDTNSGTDTGAH